MYIHFPFVLCIYLVSENRKIMLYRRVAAGFTVKAEGALSRKPDLADQHFGE